MSPVPMLVTWFLHAVGLYKLTIQPFNIHEETMLLYTSLVAAGQFLKIALLTKADFEVFVFLYLLNLSIYLVLS